MATTFTFTYTNAALDAKIATAVAAYNAANGTALTARLFALQLLKDALAVYLRDSQLASTTTTTVAAISTDLGSIT